MNIHCHATSAEATSRYWKNLSQALQLINFIGTSSQIPNSIPFSANVLVPSMVFTSLLPCPPPHKVAVHCNHKGFISQNVLGVCDFSMWNKVSFVGASSSGPMQHERNCLILNIQPCVM
ncbi:hypothetical protein VP01_207g1 [Puccinia sorghi]|uniref:Uncharacterized protein n=1 Tax=Puccinia sorghi TaxID=27349 RepID=A0A0L6VAI5_9BASI|nr:hypothetical protein VP01_207g1 [Puccinia sorghi]